MAQFGRALRSGRRGRVFESRRLDYTWPIGQEVKTTPSHGVIPGSIPGLVTGCEEQPCFYQKASVAQSVAQRIRNAWVAGSSPAGSFYNKGI